jgi:hypothetical protein
MVRVRKGGGGNGDVEGALAFAIHTIFLDSLLDIEPVRDILLQTLQMGMDGEMPEGFAKEGKQWKGGR